MSGNINWWNTTTTTASTTTPLGIGYGGPCTNTLYANSLTAPLTALTTQQQYRPAPPPLDTKHAEDMIMQFEHDGIVVKDGKLLFGAHVAKSLRVVPIEYIVTLGMAMKGLRRALLNEVRRRRVVERLPKK
jgi:hypothetical protein